MTYSDIQSQSRRVLCAGRASVVVIVTLVFLIRIGNLAAHEFWIEPTDFTANTGTPIVAALKNGENFKGNSLPFQPSLFEQFTLTDKDGTIAIEGRLGDVPALSLLPRQTGVAVLAYESKKKTVRYEKFSKFEAFAAMEGIEWVLDEHKRQKLPTTYIAEAYFRYAKSLILVGPANDAGSLANDHDMDNDMDKYQGMPLELVLLDNPYAAQGSRRLSIRVLFNGEPLARAQLSIFEKARGLVDRLRSDERGVVSWTFEPGTYLLNAVHAMRPSKTLVTQTGALWQTLWASTTFMIP